MSVTSRMSSNSGRAVNYSVRPAKNMERKMIRDLFSRLQPFGELSDYFYVGFGAKYFVDFSLFHKQLHIRNMLSIEKDRANIERYEFNKPFSCIDMKHGQSNDILPGISYDRKILCWLDYDGLLKNSVLSDIATLLESVKSGSVFAISYNTQPYRMPELANRYGKDISDKKLVLKELGCSIRSEMLPSDVPESGLAKQTVFSKILRKVVFNQIDKTLTNRNAGLAEREKWKFSQIMYFNYQDGACMSTIGGVVYQEFDSEKFESCSFGSLDCYRSNDDAYSINVPNLTMREISRLQESMPLVNEYIDRGKLPDTIFPEQDILDFAKVYKYFPNFFEIENA